MRILIGKKAFVLVASLLFSSILVILVLPYVARITTEYQLMTKIYSSTAALDLAEAAVERGLWEIAHNSCTFSGWATTFDGSNNQTSSTTANGVKTASNNVIGDYDVTAWISADGLTAVVTGVGYVPNRARPDATRRVKVSYARHNFGKAVIGLNGITMTGQAKTDSYNSALGPYASQTPGQQGDIASNGAITLSGQAKVNGDANPGAGYPFSGTPNVTGSYGTLQAPLTVDPIPTATVTAAATTNNNSNITVTTGGTTVPYTGGTNLSVSGSSVITLPGGTYYFTSVSVTGQAAINITGPSTVYVDGGSISVSGQGIVNNGQPRNLLLYSTGSSINLSGQSAFSGAIYAPAATVTLTGQDNLYGAIVCGTNVDSGQAKIHFDLDLMNVTPVFSSNRVSSWQEPKS
jgi:hypothetical protein